MTDKDITRVQIGQYGFGIVGIRRLMEELAEECADKSDAKVAEVMRWSASASEGGMGEICMAEQEQPVRRRVSLKLIKVGMDTLSAVARFKPKDRRSR